MLSTKLPEAGPAALPRQVQIEPVAECNLRCQMCSLPFRDDLRVAERPAFMEFSLFTDLVEQFRGVEELHLQGLGEPMLHPAFFAMVSFAFKRGIRVSTNSNMTLLDQERAEECVLSGLSWIRASIDGATAETYESIRIGSRFDRVLQNIDFLRRTKMRLRSSRPRMFLVMVVMKRNVAELKEIVRLAHDCGMEQVFVQHLCHDLSVSALPGQYRSMHDFVEEQSLAGSDRRMVQSCFNEALAVAGKLKIDLRLPHIGTLRHPGLRTATKRCDWPWRSAYFTYDGRAMPCCMIGLPGRFNFGSVAERRFLNIWNGEGYRRFRAQLASEDPPAVCRTCSLYQGTF
jgi:MoaA/NifB/PqqE/SkfB family radical SAM enzyme